MRLLGNGWQGCRQEFPSDLWVKHGHFNVTAKSASDLHSSLAAFVDNAVWRLVQVCQFTRPKGEVGRRFTDGVKPLTQTEQAAVDQLPFNEEATRKNFGLKLPLLSDNRRALINRPTITINGFLRLRG